MTEQEFNVDTFRNAVQTNDVVVADEPANPAETPAVEKTEGVEKIEEKKESLFDKYKKPEEEVKTPVADFLKPEPVVTKFEETPEYKTWLTEKESIAAEKNRIEELKKTKAYKLIAGELDLKDVDLAAVLKQAQGENFNKLSDAELIAKEAQSKYKYLTGENLDKAIAKEKESFEALEDWEQENKRAEIIDMLEKSKPENDVMKVLNELKEIQKAPNEPDPEKYMSVDSLQAKIDDIKTNYDKIGEGLVGQKYGEYTATKDDVAATKGLFEKLATAYNIEDAYMAHFKAATYDAYGKSEYERGKAEAKIADANPGKGVTEGVIIPITQEQGITEKTSADDFRKAK